MITNPRVTVIMLAYNSEKYIGRAVESILNQTFKNFELIIINDGSTDLTPLIINKYKKDDDRIMIIDNITNKGIVYSRNIGLSVAKGEYIAIQDSDDNSFENRIFHQVNYLDSNKDVFMVVSNAVLIDGNNNLIKKVKLEFNGMDLKKRLEEKNSIFHSSVMFINEKRFYREKFSLAEDYDFYLLALSDNKKISGLPECLIEYRVACNSASFTNQAKIRLFSEKALLFYKQRLNYNKDEYDNFDPDEILNIDINITKKATVIGSVIRNSYLFKDYKTSRIFCLKYFKNYGFINKYIVYFTASFFGATINNLLIKYLPTGIIRFLNK